MVTAAMVIMEVESRCVCLASLAVSAAICVFVRDSAWVEELGGLVLLLPLSGDMLTRLI